MSDVVVFNGLNALDFFEVRSHIVRIPEVSVRIRRAQEIWDHVSSKQIDLLNYLTSPDSVFLSHVQIKGLLTAIVQVALFDRYIRLFKIPKFLIGSSNGDSAVLTCAGHQNFDDMVLKSRAMQEPKILPFSNANLPSGEMPVLLGFELAQFEAYVHLDDMNAFSKVENCQNLDVKSIVRRLMDEFDVTKIINIGPGNSNLSRQEDDVWLENAMITESIEMDPMLNWFWSNVTLGQAARAN